MSFILVELYLDQSQQRQVKSALSEYESIGIWKEQTTEQVLIKILLDSSQVESFIDHLQTSLPAGGQFRLLLLPVKATLPLLDSLDLPQANQLQGIKSSCLPREVIYTQISQDIILSVNQIAMVVLSTIIAAIGLQQSNQAVIIGAMVLAPLLKPNIALAVATTIGNWDLIKRTVKVGIIGITVALAASVVLGVVFPVQPQLSEIAFRTRVHLTDVVLALAAGVAGSLSITMEENSAIVGVMVSVALLPPLVALGMLMGSGYWQPALGSGVLVLTNIACVNLAAIATLLILDIRPRSWWAAIKAKKVTKVASLVWFSLVSLLIGVILLMNWRYNW